MSTYSICMILNYGIVLETFPIKSRFIFPNVEDLDFLRELLQIRMPEDIKYKINEFLLSYRIKYTDLYYNNKNYGLYSLMDFTTDIINKHRTNNIYLLNLSYEALYLKTFEYIRGYRSKKPRLLVFSTLPPCGICSIENGAIVTNIAFDHRGHNVKNSDDFFKAKQIDPKENLPKDWYKAFHNGRIMEGYLRDTNIYAR